MNPDQRDPKGIGQQQKAAGVDSAVKAYEATSQESDSIRSELAIRIGVRLQVCRSLRCLHRHPLSARAQGVIQVNLSLLDCVIKQFLSYTNLPTLGSDCHTVAGTWIARSRAIHASTSTNCHRIDS